MKLVMFMMTRIRRVNIENGAKRLFEGVDAPVDAIGADRVGIRLFPVWLHVLRKWQSYCPMGI
jgi:hypothetical protein